MFRLSINRYNRKHQGSHNMTHLVQHQIEDQVEQGFRHQIQFHVVHQINWKNIYCINGLHLIYYFHSIQFMAINNQPDVHVEVQLEYQPYGQIHMLFNIDINCK